ncbi:nucleotidyltransferase domain-containing protein [uncultured Clostridium sp.]|uniref:nucleotidyltransferase domain-containing protein n=1 Tax=uncultured Clostridium sp. TaxID=59620 RepID=UPI0025DF0436|nr:nucleotidyltransferase domain-containing protein [uncultured Clostridium sp.]
MEKLLSNLKVSNNNENLISLTLFGSYNTKHWFEGKSDIDILALVKKNDFNSEFEIENRYREVLQKYFNYDDIHFTFIGLNSFDTVFADIYIDYKDKLIFDIDLHYDFLMYISKFNRVNENLIKLVREDWESKYGIL